MRFLGALLALAGALMSGTPARGQVGVPTASDARVRLELTNGRMLKGRIAAVDRDSVYLMADNAASTRAIATTLIRTLQQSEGRDRWRGVRRGALVTGVISLAAITMAVYTNMQSEDAIIPSTLFVVPPGLLQPQRPRYYDQAVLLCGRCAAEHSLVGQNC